MGFLEEKPYLFFFLSREEKIFLYIRIFVVAGDAFKAFF
jgi:hypothetical protein